MRTRSKHEFCLHEKKAVPAPEKCKHAISLRSRRIRWRPAVRDGQLLKGGSEGRCIPCWQEDECYPNLKHTGALNFPIHIYHIFSMLFISLPLFLSFILLPSICHFYLQFFLYSFSASLPFAFAFACLISLSVVQISPARMESLSSFQDREDIRSIGSLWDMSPPAK